MRTAFPRRKKTEHLHRLHLITKHEIKSCKTKREFKPSTLTGPLVVFLYEKNKTRLNTNTELFFEFIILLTKYRTSIFIRKSIFCFHEHKAIKNIIGHMLRIIRCNS